MPPLLPAPRAGIWPEKVSFTTYARALNGAPDDGMVMCRPPPSWLRVGRLVEEPAVWVSSCTDVSELRLIWLEFSVAMVSVLPGQPRTVAYRTVLSLLRVNRMSWALPSRGV